MSSMIGIDGVKSNANFGLNEEEMEKIAYGVRSMLGL